MCASAREKAALYSPFAPPPPSRRPAGTRAPSLPRNAEAGRDNPDNADGPPRAERPAAPPRVARRSRFFPLKIVYPSRKLIHTGDDNGNQLPVETNAEALHL